jgi:SAM-dependent methyltransferase
MNEDQKRRTRPSRLCRGASKLMRVVRTPELELEIPPRSINYNQGRSGGRAGYVHQFKNDACLKELPFLIQRCGLSPNSALLDYGCGFGRLAYAASRYLAEDGSYFGYEPNQTALKFLKQAYGNRKNFAFAGQELPYEEDYIAVRSADARSSGVAPTAMDLTNLVTRPLRAQWTSSVFSHMWIDPIVHVLRSIRELLEPDGVCVNTWLCIDDFAAYVLRCGLADRTFPYRINGAWTTTDYNPLACTAYELGTVREIYERAGHVIEDILWGSWSGRENGVTYLDVIISRWKP